MNEFLLILELSTVNTRMVAALSCAYRGKSKRLISLGC